MASASFTTLGCKVNQYETQKILESFELAGFEVVPFEAPADVVVINTCSVTSDAESKSRYAIRKAARTNPNAKILVTGCAGQMASNRGESIDGAHVIVPNPEKLDSLKWLLRAYPSLEPAFIGLQNVPRPRIQNRSRATLKIQDGCSVMCSYCSIPFTRPVMASRPWFEVIEEAETMAQMGYREIVLTGVLIGSYGPATGSQGPDFEALIERLSAIRAIERIRISSIEMRQVTPRLFDLLKSGVVVPHLHIPLQSGDSGVLADMNRPYTQSDYLDLCQRLYSEIADFSLTTDIMVGFPTESSERFESSLHVCREARYLKAHVFRFSPRFGTPADLWGDPVSHEEKGRRSRLLGEASRETGRMHARQFLGRTMRVVVETKDRQSGLACGLTDNYLEARFAAPDSLRFQTTWIRLDDERDGVLYGEMVTAPKPGIIGIPRRAGDPVSVRHSCRNTPEFSKPSSIEPDPFSLERT
jgi:threonylcarbamoyladenosine tRNA methylthiotransferase MtaB